jgi:hypothetical protein
MRRKDRELTDPAEILGIVEKTKYLHLGLMDGDYPYVVPLHYGYEYTDCGLVFYMHCAGEGHKIDLIRENPNAFVELECNVETVSGGDVPCKYGSTYASVMGRGTVEIVSDESEKIRGLEILMKHQSGRDFTLDRKIAATVEILKVTVPEFTGKARKV